MGRGKILEEDPYWGTSQFVCITVYGYGDQYTRSLNLIEGK